MFCLFVLLYHLCTSSYILYHLCTFYKNIFRKCLAPRSNIRRIHLSYSNFRDKFSKERGPYTSWDLQYFHRWVDCKPAKKEVPEETLEPNWHQTTNEIWCRTNLGTVKCWLYLTLNKVTKKKEVSTAHTTKFLNDFYLEQRRHI